jgi:hypothetical protein
MRSLSEAQVEFQKEGHSQRVALNALSCARDALIGTEERLLADSGF